MKQKQITMDKFRLIAAILIIAIHTYPLITYSENLDFMFTHIFCRIGVPFFLMVTGYFVLRKAMIDKKTLMQYTLKIIKIYVICMVIYFPINIYAGQLKGIGLLGVVKDIFINGTFYHLWYFPAVVLGLWITYFIIKKVNASKSLYIFIILYIIGLFGDSYYGISEKFGLTKGMYNVIFSIFDYTRNGLFFAPIFLYIGYKMKNMNLKLNRQQNIIFIAIFIVLMIIEGLILHCFNIQRHDSMYIMLIPVMIGLFNLIVQGKNENNKNLRNISTTIYIMHPIFIIVVRGIAKVLHVQNIMINNSIIHYVLVVILTVIFSIFFEKLKVKVNNILKFSCNK